MASFGAGEPDEGRQPRALLRTRCADCGVTFDARPDARLGVPVRCQPCADREAARLREIARTGGRCLTVESLLDFERLKDTGPRGRRRG